MNATCVRVACGSFLLTSGQPFVDVVRLMTS